MKYYKTPDGYIVIDETVKLKANGTTVPTNILASGRGPQTPNDVGSVAAQVFNMQDILKFCPEVEPQAVPMEWREALGLVKVAPVCQTPAGEATPEKVYGPDFPPMVTTVFFFIGVLVGMFIHLALKIF
jgi:hypothetical protein